MSCIKASLRLRFLGSEASVIMATISVTCGNQSSKYENDPFLSMAQQLATHLEVGVGRSAELNGVLGNRLEQLELIFNQAPKKPSQDLPALLLDENAVSAKLRKGETLEGIVQSLVGVQWPRLVRISD